MKKINRKQIDTLKENVEKMAKSNEQFFFMIFKNPDGTDNITQYSFNMVPDKMTHYWQEALKKAKIKEGL